MSLRLRCVCAALAFLLSAPMTATALDAPVILENYRILPRVSSFTQTGGFAGVRERYHVEGGYGFATTWDYDFDTRPTGIARVAWFVDADVRAPLGPHARGFYDVDQLLNLEGLRGKLLPQPLAFTPFEVYRFRGHINDSDATSPLEQSTIDLFAVTYGPWMYLHGDTTPPVGSADYFEYELRALARTRPWADMNGDDRVDAADYTLLRDGEAASGVVRGPDHPTIADWQSQFGQRVPDLELFQLAIRTALAQQPAPASVPEPAAGVLALLAVACWRRR